jgi:hypothetical protein
LGPGLIPLNYMPKTKLPVVEYTGQTLAEILALNGTHSTYSLVAAIEQGIQLRQRNDPAHALTAPEVVFLAVMSFEREVNNGGFAQFFGNSSREFAGHIVSALEQVGMFAKASLATRAIDCLAMETISGPAVLAAILRDDPERDARLNALDHEFYSLTSSPSQLVTFIEAHRGDFVLEKTTVAPPEISRGATKAGFLSLALRLDPHTDFSYAAVRQLAVQLAAQSDRTEGATEADLEGGVCLHLFGHCLRNGDLDGCEEWARRAFELCWEDSSHGILHKDWMGKLLEAGRDERADAVALEYLVRLEADDKKSRFIRKRVGFFAGPIRENSARLPESARFLSDHFAPEEIAPPLVIYKGLRSAMKAIHQPSAVQRSPTNDVSDGN